MKPLTTLVVALATAVAPACVIAPEEGRMSPATASPAPAARAEPIAAEPILYARDGTPVRAAGPEPYARNAAVDGPAHGVQRSEGSRMYLLELYQEAVDTKEALELELRSVHADLALVRKDAAAVRESLGASQADVARLEGLVEEYRTELRELASRLVTAQIRRLESDKLLLESKIEWAQTRRVIESAATGAANNGGGNR